MNTPGKILIHLGFLFSFAFNATLNCFSQLHNQHSSLFFYQLDTEGGLSDNYIHDMTVDKTGNLWIATGEGLNMFNGSTAVKFFSSEYPQMHNNFLRQLVCDNNNRIWVLHSDGHVTVIDEQLRFHSVSLYLNKEFVPTRRILQTTSAGIILFTTSGHYNINRNYQFEKNDSLGLQNFTPLTVDGFDSPLQKTMWQIEPLKNDNYVFLNDDGIYKVNYKDRKMTSYKFQGYTFLTQWANDELLVYNKKNQGLEVINLATEKISYPFQNMTDQYDNIIKAVFTNAKYINDHQLLLTTIKQGLYLFDKNENKIYNYRHNAADASTIINNSPRVIAVDSTGWVFIGATPNGVSYFKSNAVIGQQTIFQDKTGRSYDGYINSITTLDNDTYYIGVSDYLLRWKRSTNTTVFVNYGLDSNDDVNCLYFDKKNRLWISTAHNGIFILDNNNRPLKHLTHDATANSLQQKIVNHLETGKDGYVWATGLSGVSRINPENFSIDNLTGTPLDSLRNLYCYQSWFSDSNTVWIGTQYKGFFKYHLDTKKLENYNTSNGFISNAVICFNKDLFNNIYVGTPDGLYIFLNNGTSKIITTKNGLLNNRVEAILLDKKNRIWMGNDVGLSCFNISDTSLRVFDERYGLSIQGFRIESYHKDSDGELLWGTEKGLQYFYPDDILQQKIDFKTTINRVETRDLITDLSDDILLNLSSTDNSINFYFTSIDYSKHLRTFYEYQLEGIDKEWVKVEEQNYVRYSSLPAGKFTFRVRASNDNKVWKDAENLVIVNIAKPVYDRWWFKLAVIILAFILIWIVVNYYRNKQLRKRTELESELLLTWFASQINRHNNIKDLMWDVAKNCISKLQFQDCVIYLKDAEKNALVQVAAYGPKNPVDFTIHHPIEIPVGKGIVGTVAQTGKSEIINNTSHDERYIVDDKKRHSEIAVPVVLNGNIIAVIDSEHSQKNFYTQKHLRYLSAIAALCANQVQRIQAEEEKQKTTIELLENKRKAMESRLQSLRLQMNPHFLFNALNSIQQMILANEELVATRYLSKFSKLLRSILVHSDNESITLKEELEILNLYVELESVRFKENFKYRIECSEEVETEEVKVPTLLIQPFVENAIWHGLMHKEGDRELVVEFTDEGDFVKCVIEDNGIGREKATELKFAAGKDSKHKSKGIEVSVERLKTLKNSSGRMGSITIIDLTDENGNASGTRVEINIPVQN